MTASKFTGPDSSMSRRLREVLSSTCRTPDPPPQGGRFTPTLGPGAAPLCASLWPGLAPSVSRAASNSRLTVRPAMLKSGAVIRAGVAQDVGEWQEFKTLWA